MPTPQFTMYRNATIRNAEKIRKIVGEVEFTTNEKYKDIILLVESDTAPNHQYFSPQLWAYKVHKQSMGILRENKRNFNNP